MHLLILALLTADPAAAADTIPADDIALCRHVLPIADISRSSAQAVLYRRVLALWDDRWDAMIQAAGNERRFIGLDAAARTKAATASRQTRNMYADACVAQSGLSANEQIVE